jgi:hypothetical protein
MTNFLDIIHCPNFYFKWHFRNRVQVEIRIMDNAQKIYHCVLNMLSNKLIMNVMQNTTRLQWETDLPMWHFLHTQHNETQQNCSHANCYSPCMVSSESLLTSYRRIASSSSICVEIVHGSPKNKDRDKQLLKIKFTYSLIWAGFN